MQSRYFGASFSQAMQILALLLISLTCTQAAEAANSRLPRTSLAHFGYTATSGTRNGLPATCMDSFVKNAGQRADAIYGDEGIGDNPPPFYGGFTKEHRINAGIVGKQDAGLTTGHSERLPDAWGRDEYLGQEWSQSGSNNGGYDLASSPDIQVVASYDIPVAAPVTAPSYQVPIRKAYSSATSSGAGYRTYANANSQQSNADSGF